MSDSKLRKFVDGRMPGLLSIVTTFVIIEIVIFAICMAYTTNKDVVKIYNPENEIIYEDRYNANNISEFKRLNGIRSFKGEGYTIKRFEEKNPFPTRAWIALSVCVPMLLVMFVVFIIKVFNDVFHLKRKDTDRERDDNGAETDKEKKTTGFEETRFEKLFSAFERMNIYTLGFTIVIIVFLYWVIPDLLIYLSKVSYQTISELKWVILGLVVFAGVFLILKIVLSYKTKAEIIRQQADIQKHRDQLAIEYQQIDFETKQLENKGTASSDSESSETFREKN